MEKQIWKYQLEQMHSSIMMPIGAEILTMQLQNGKPCIWALVDPEAEKSIREIEIHGTGHDISYTDIIQRKYIGTYQVEPFVFHVFERI